MSTLSTTDTFPLMLKEIKKSLSRLMSHYSVTVWLRHHLALGIRINLFFTANRHSTTTVIPRHTPRAWFQVGHTPTALNSSSSVSKLWPVEGCRTDAVSLLTLQKSAVDPPQSQCSGLLQTIGRMVSGWSHSHSLEWFLVSVKALAC
jgi:hypothetical protein